jgi:hypothetical protein
MSPFILPQEPDRMSTDGFLDTFLDHQPQFTLEDLDGLGFPEQRSLSVMTTDPPDSTNSDPNTFSPGDTILRRSPIDSQGGSSQAQSSSLVDEMPILDCSADLAEHL